MRLGLLVVVERRLKPLTIGSNVAESNIALWSIDLVFPNFVYSNISYDCEFS